MSKIVFSVTVADRTSPVAFSGAIAPTAISWSYRLGLLLVTVAMILVPLLYVLLIAAVAWFFVWHLTTNAWILDGLSNVQFRLLGYLTPAVASATLLFFMVKPILARRATRADPVQVLEDEQPDLHALIRDICRHVRAPVPARVYVDCQVNASASLRSGTLAVFRRDLDLTIGLPLVTGLSVRQLSGVLAHEFGHFAQGGGMRMTLLIRYVNAWLFRVVHERDTWDSTLDEWSKEGDWRVVVPMALARGSVWVSRQALAGVAMVGHGVSCYMLRQMEFDADSYEVRVAGSDTFARTSSRFRELLAGSHVAYRHMPQLFDKHAIPADLPQFIADCSHRLPDEIRDQVQEMSDKRTGTFDTHPSDADRVAAAHALAVSGSLIGGDEPATILFRDFDRLSATVTRQHYECDLGIELGKVGFLDKVEALRGADEQRRTDAAVDEVFASRVSFTRPLRIQIEASAEGVVDLDETLARTRAAVQESSVTQESYRAFEDFLRRRALAFCAEQLFLAGLDTVDAQEFALPEPTLAVAQSTQSWALQELDKLRSDLDAFDELVARRLGLGVRLLEHHGIGAEARAVALAVSALAEAVLIVVDSERFLMAVAYVDEAAPALGTSAYLRTRSLGLDAGLDRCRAVTLEIFSKAPVPVGELHDRWQRLLADAPQLPRHDFMQRVMDLNWACLTRLARLVTDGEASRAGASLQAGFRCDEC